MLFLQTRKRGKTPHYTKMSNESIPIGTLCSECDKRASCRTLCEYAEQYANQDSIPQREQILADLESTFAVNSRDYKDVLHTRMRNIERGQILTPKNRAIVSMYLADVPIKQIASLHNCSDKYIYKVIARLKK